MAYRVIGGSQPRADAWEKVRGRPIYAGDLAVAGMLHARIARSPYASARIVRIDTSEARALPGVVAVLTHADVPQNALRMELPGRMAEATAGAVLATQAVLAEDRVRFQGEPVAAIADRKITRLNSSHLVISYAVFCLKKKTYLSTRSAASSPTLSLLLKSVNVSSQRPAYRS